MQNTSDNFLDEGRIISWAEWTGMPPRFISGLSWREIPSGSPFVPFVWFFSMPWKMDQLRAIPVLDSGSSRKPSTLICSPSPHLEQPPRFVRHHEHVSAAFAGKRTLPDQ